MSAITVSEIKPILLFQSALVDNATAAIPEVDSLIGGVWFRQVIYVVYLGATDIALSAFKVTESDTSGTGHTDITATVAGAAGFDLPSGTDDNKLYLIEVAFKKRFTKLVITAGDGSTGANLTVFCILGNPQSVDLATLLPAARGLTDQEVVGA